MSTAREEDEREANIPTRVNFISSCHSLRGDDAALPPCVVMILMMSPAWCFCVPCAALRDHVPALRVVLLSDRR